MLSDRCNVCASFLAFLLCSSMSALAAAPQTPSQSVCVMDADTGEILYEKDAYTQLPMASITKTMTALVAMENSDLHSKKGICYHRNDKMDI